MTKLPDDYYYYYYYYLVRFGLLYHFVPQSYIFTLLSLQFLTFIFFKSSSTWSSHLNLGLPTGLDEHGFHSVTFLTVLAVSILITCAAQRNLCDFINFTIFFFLIRFYNSSFVVSSMLHHCLVLVSKFF